MIQLYSDFFEALRLAKALDDRDRFKELRHQFDCCTLDGDTAYEISLETLGLIFQDTNVYYNDESDFETWVLMDPAIDHFCRLCRRYEERKGIGEEDDPYIRELIRTIHSAFSLGANYDYNYSWKLSAKDRGRKRILFFLGPEFCGLFEMPMALLEIWEGFRHLNRKLEKELELNLPVPICPVTERKEAAA